MKASPIRGYVTGWTAEPGMDFSSAPITQAEIGLGIALLPDGKRREALTLAAAMFTEEFADANLPFDQGAAARYAARLRIALGSAVPSAPKMCKSPRSPWTTAWLWRLGTSGASKKSRGSHYSRRGRRHEKANRAEAREKVKEASLAHFGAFEEAK